MEFLDIKWHDDDLMKLMFRFLLNGIFLIIIVRYIYYSRTRKSQYAFSYFMINILVFLICFTLKKFELQLGMALGLFALFGILRYRTNAIPIREMTYLFIVIGIAVVNSLANKKMSYSEILFTNVAIIIPLLLLEKGPFFDRSLKKEILYERIDLIRPENHQELMADLKFRTGLNINRIEIGSINFLRDTAKIRIYYKQEDQNSHIIHEDMSYEQPQSVDPSSETNTYS